MANNIEQAYELTLVVRSQIGDEAAFEKLLRAYSPRLRAYVSRMLGTQHERADDVLQEIWVNVFRALPRLNDAAAFRSWLFRIARDRVCREFRRRHVVFSPLDQSGSEEIVEESNKETPAVETIRMGLDQLSPDHREMLMLRFMEDMSYEEIGCVTGGSPGTVRSRIHYAKRALRRALEEKNYETK